MWKLSRHCQLLPGSVQPECVAKSFLSGWEWHSEAWASFSPALVLCWAFRMLPSVRAGSWLLCINLGSAVSVKDNKVTQPHVWLSGNTFMDAMVTGTKCAGL